MVETIVAFRDCAEGAALLFEGYTESA